MFQHEEGPEDIINQSEWQKIQDSFAEAFGITINTFAPDGNLFSNSSRPLGLDNGIKGLDKCSRFSSIDFIRSVVKDVKEINKDLNLQAHFGLNFSILPIKAFGNKPVVYLVVGPTILQGRKTPDEYAKEAKEFGITSDELTDELLQIKAFSYNKNNLIINLLKDVFSQIARTGYHKKRLGEITPEVLSLDPVLSEYYEEKILNCLLGSCALALNADSGSVMTLNPDTNTLHIKAASRLNDDIINQTAIKVGEGIAGVAAATSETIILPKDKGKNGLSNKMRREYIKSSMIVPFKKADTDSTYGVINLNIVKKEVEFTERDIMLVNNLVRMAGIALVPLRKTK